MNRIHERLVRHTACASFLAGLSALAGASIALGEDAAVTSSRTVQEHQFTNRLIDSNDPYLLQHAHNPVDWYAWGPEALDKARREHRPIFISVGYSTCYWCHVAERTIYSDERIAKLMNQWFVNIKIDREQRPDLDNIYVLATQLMTGHAGWPNNVFLTPDLKPFFAGSYFPPQDTAGRSGFPTILKAIHEAWTEREMDVQKQADTVYSAMLETQIRGKTENSARVLSGEWSRRARETLLQSYDTSDGGFGRGPTKFPREPALSLLLAEYRASHESKVLRAVTGTLDAMAFGGIHDHLGGGFHRYSTDSSWSVPHFEKMLYDNAQLLEIYSDAFQLSGNALYRMVAEDVAAYLTQQMMAPDGGFYAAQDAEVEGHEGVSFVWTHKEIDAILGSEAAERFFQVYSLAPLTASGTGDPESGEGVLRVRKSIGENSSRADERSIVDLLVSLHAARAKLLTVRNLRPQPARDEKIIVAWNALAIRALIHSGTALGSKENIRFARKAAERLWKDAYLPKSGELKHQIYRDRAQIAAFLDDYALFGVALMGLAEVTGDEVWRDRAASLATAMLKRFATKDGLITTVGAKDLLFSPKDDGDNTSPSGTSAALELLARLHAATGDASYAQSAMRILARTAGEIQQSPDQWPAAIVALSRFPLPQKEFASRDTTPATRHAAVTMPSSADHVKASGKVHSAPDHDEISVTISVADGYHINANPATFDYLIATSLSIDGAPNINLNYPPATLIKPKFAPDGLKVYQGTLSLTAIATKGTIARATVPMASLSVQACNDEVCLPPAILPVELKRE